MNLTVVDGKNTERIKFKEGERLIETLHANGIFINTYCGGRGICGKCVVRYVKNPPPPTKFEIQTFSKLQLEKGYRLACMHKTTYSTVEVFRFQPAFTPFESEPCCEDEGRYLVVDIGTTTIAMAFIENRTITKTVNFLNPQLAFGSDIISRIYYSNQGNLLILKNSVGRIIKDAIGDFSPKSMVICANPTMLAFFLGVDPKSIGEYPYIPPFTGSFEGEWNGIQIYVPPIISAFVGSDISSALSILPCDENYLFIDIGTNCELILKYSNGFVSSSIPAGPALEGAAIEYGTIAREGAIYKVTFDQELKISTISDKQPIGITGSGLISAIALLRKFGIIDRNGNLVEPWESEAPLTLINRIEKRGFYLGNGVYLTQNSIRSFQLVKASLNAALDILFKKVNIEKIDRVYLGGGFSKDLTKDEIRSSELLSFDSEFVMLGNSSLAGGVKLFCNEFRHRVETISKKVRYIEIANEKEFEKLYIDKMGFLDE